MLSPPGDGANLSSPLVQATEHWAWQHPPQNGFQQHDRQTPNTSPRGPGPPKHCTHWGGLGLRNPLSRMFQVQDISLNCVLEKNNVIWAIKEQSAQLTARAHPMERTSQISQRGPDKRDWLSKCHELK